MRKQWKMLSVSAAKVKHLQHELRIHPVFCQLLIQQGIETYDQAKTFFRPQLSDLHDPFLMKDMDLAVQRINQAIHNKEKVLLYGDYDVDGTTSVATMYRFLSPIHPFIDYYIPNRYKEGYGVSYEGIDYARQNGISLIIAMDCGIRAVEKVDVAKAHGIDFIICDHHKPGDQLPEAAAVLDPKRSDCDYPYKELCGCGVTFKLIQAFCQQNELSSHLWKDLLELLVIAIAADIVPITGENRTLAYFGLKKINTTQHPGLKALIKESRKRLPLSISDIVFGLAPMINAAGRLSDAKYAVKLLLANNKHIAYENASYLYQKNKLRKEYDQLIAEEAKNLFNSRSDKENRKSIVLYQPHWHKGIIGIAASRIVEHFNRPAIILTESNGKMVGSARSIEGISIYNVLQECSDLLDNFGGHDYAAGMTMDIDNLETFERRVESAIQKFQPNRIKDPIVNIQASLFFKDITPKFMGILKQFAPFGPGNRNPVFMSEYVRDTGYSRGLVGNHLKLSLEQDEEHKMNGIAFGQAEHLADIKSGRPFHICYKLEENYWKEEMSIQLNVKDFWF